MTTGQEEVRAERQLGVVLQDGSERDEWNLDRLVKFLFFYIVSSAFSLWIIK